MSNVVWDVTSTRFWVRTLLDSKLLWIKTGLAASLHMGGKRSVSWELEFLYTWDTDTAMAFESRATWHDVVALSNM